MRMRIALSVTTYDERLAIDVHRREVVMCHASSRFEDIIQVIIREVRTAFEGGRIYLVCKTH